MNNEIFIYSFIGDEESGGVTASQVHQSLSKMDGDVDVYINSPGGDVFAGRTIYHAIKGYSKGTVTAHVVGYCGSIATLIALGCKKIVMYDGAKFMIHQSSVGQMSGRSSELKSMADELEGINNDLVEAYHEKTGLPKEQIIAMMDKETTMNAHTAKELKFVDEVKKSLKISARYNHVINNNMDKKAKSAKELLASFTNSFSKIFGEGEEAEVSNLAMKTSEGKNIYIESDDIETAVGKAAYMADEEGNKTEELLPDGELSLEGGVTLVIEGGVVSEIKSSELEEARKEIENLKAQIEQITAQKTTAESKVEEAKIEMLAFKKQLDEFQEMPAFTSKAKMIVVNEQKKKENKLKFVNI
jgi:ATP-dependent Clp protease protease subunit